MATHDQQQSPFARENLHPVHHRVRHPDVTVSVDRNPFWPGEISRTIAGLPEGADEIAATIKDLDAVIERVRDIDVAFAIHRHICREREVAGIG